MNYYALERISKENAINQPNTVRHEPSKHPFGCLDVCRIAPGAVVRVDLLKDRGYGCCSAGTSQDYHSLEATARLAFC